MQKFCFNILKNNNPMKLKTYFLDFLNLFFPKICAVCNANLYKNEEVICTRCEYHIPRTNFYKEPGNPVEQVFWGRVPIENACSFFYFDKGGKYQKLIHNLKYKSQKEIGTHIGKLFGFDLVKNELYKNADYLIPVPLHPKKEKKRGFNQSLMIAEGLAESMNIEIDSKNLFRKQYTESQTRKNRFDRWKNVEDIFGLRKPEKFKDKHVILIDDVLTTGSTIEACSQALLKAKGIKISVVTLAYA